MLEAVRAKGVEPIGQLLPRFIDRREVFAGVFDIDALGYAAAEVFGSFREVIGKLKELAVTDGLTKRFLGVYLAESVIWVADAEAIADEDSVDFSEFVE